MSTKYEIIADKIRQRIIDKTYEPDNYLPNQKILMNEFNVSRTTLNKAITVLVMEGLVYSKRGAGTKIINRKFWYENENTDKHYQGLAARMKKANRILVNKIIEFNVELSNNIIQNKLKLKEKSPVYKIIRLRVLDSKPYMLEHTYIPVNLVPGLTEKESEKSIFEYMRNILKIQFSGSFKYFRADIPNSYDIEYLKCSENDPIFQIEETNFTLNGEPIEYSISRNKYNIRGYALREVNFK
ncbi:MULTISPECIES: GntR family transcriptional regulator [Clostridium]|uniref:GntR family transcriptional regulator n=1 Tax=Clostridium TaxID=1485 RepID=UPI0008270E24|nr:MULTISPECIES: GntR family transcriptional regulator [Clostridium]PJI10207.1 GntR family transcriptional regulator [Clostridium sp. CT7]